MLKKRALSALLSLVMILGILSSLGFSAAAKTVNPFVDVKSTDYFYEPVLWAVNAKPQITAGIDATHFGPGNPCTRGQVVAFLWRSAGQPEPKSANNPFRDVKKGEYYYSAVLWAVENGITAGLSANTFGPNSTCTRGQIVSFIYRYEGQPSTSGLKNNFADVKQADWFYAPVLWAAANRITSGTDATHFSPNAVCTRGQVVSFLYRDIAQKEEGPSSINVCIYTDSYNLDPHLFSSTDAATLVAHLFSGLAKWGQDEGGKLVILPDAAEELPEGTETGDGRVTYTYTLREGLKWSDGRALTAHDFVFSWNRAASPELNAAYSYMFEYVDGYDAMWEQDGEGNYINPDAKLNVKALDDRTLQVTAVSYIPYWDELLAFPSYYPVREDAISDSDWAADKTAFVCNGPYVVDNWESGSVIGLKKNEKYIDSDKITMDEINFRMSDDPAEMLSKFKSAQWQFIDDVPGGEISSLKENYPDEFVIAGQIGTYYLSWNVNKKLLPDSSSLTGADAERAEAEIRNALSILIDRNYITGEIFDAGQVPASSLVAMGLTDADGTQFYENAGNNSAYSGYYNVDPAAYESNRYSAINTLKKYYSFDGEKFSDFPAITYLFNSSPGHQAIGDYLQETLSDIGITLNFEAVSWAELASKRNEGNFTLVRGGWISDFNDPASFLEMYTSYSYNNDPKLGKYGHGDIAAYSLDLCEFADVLGENIKVENGTWAQTYDLLISKIRTCRDKETRYKLMHIAEDLLMSTGAVCPLYYYTDLYMIDDGVRGFFSNPLGFKYFMYTTVSK